MNPCCSMLVHAHKQVHKHMSICLYICSHHAALLCPRLYNDDLSRSDRAMLVSLHNGFEGESETAAEGGEVFYPPLPALPSPAQEDDGGEDRRPLSLEELGHEERAGVIGGCEACETLHFRPSPRLTSLSCKAPGRDLSACSPAHLPFFLQV
jgi:hypothetical protein